MLPVYGRRRRDHVEVNVVVNRLRIDCSPGEWMRQQHVRGRSEDERRSDILVDEVAHTHAVDRKHDRSSAIVNEREREIPTQPLQKVASSIEVSIDDAMADLVEAGRAASGIAPQRVSLDGSADPT